MREILFRGKTNEGKWVEGQLLHFKASVGSGELAVIVEGCEWDNSNEWFNLGKRAKVLTETVGQYTGLTDKNGKKIFEGDIVKHYNNSDDGFDIGVLYWDETFSQWKRTSIGNFHHRSFTYSMSRSCDYEVIGNIHDNPEISKGE